MTGTDRDAPSERKITRLLHRASEGDTDAFGEVAEWAYGRLERLAGQRLRQRYGAQLCGVTLEPAAVAKLRLLWGLKNHEIARALEVSVPTVERDWRFAKSWLAVRLEEG